MGFAMRVNVYIVFRTRALTAVGAAMMLMFFGELRLIRYQSTNTLPGTSGSDWLAQDHGAWNINLPTLELVIACHSLLSY